MTKTLKLNFTIPEDIAQELKTRVSKNKRSAFVSQALKNTLEELRRIGIRIAIDDFGTGYSSMLHLKELPVSELKIDKSFVMHMIENENDAVIVRSMIDLSHNLGLKVVAEGIEDKNTLEILQILGCDSGQGYYFSRPVKESDLLNQLSTVVTKVFAAQ